GLVRGRHGVEVGGGRGRIIHPAPQQVAPVDDIYREALLLVLVGKVAPQRIVRPQPPQRLEREREEPPGAEGLVVVVRRVLDVHLESGAEPSGVLVERRLEPTGPQPAAAQPLRRDRKSTRLNSSHSQISY